ncbi:MAG: ribonuclease III [Dongiaceae bacterium]
MTGAASHRAALDLPALERLLGHRFRDEELLQQALTHASLLQRRSERGTVGYERLEFLGDRVLGLIVAEMLYKSFPKEDEGALARRFAAVVSRDGLARVATAIDLGRHIRVSQGERDSGGRGQAALLADACEAVIGAIYLDGGLDAARGFIEPHWQRLIAEDLRPPQDPKTALQEWAQGRGLPLPAYKLIALEGRPHEPLFTVEVQVQDKGSASGTGRSKRAAEQAAALELLQRLQAGHG